MMTEDERRQLREIERGLLATDPKLVLLMAGGTYLRPARRRRRRRTMIVMVDLLALAMIALAAANGGLVLIFVSSMITVLALSTHVVRWRARTV